VTDWDRIAEEAADINRAASDSVHADTIVLRIKEARDLAVRQGWSDEHGNSLLPEDPEDDNDQEEDQ